MVGEMLHVNQATMVGVTLHVALLPTVAFKLQAADALTTRLLYRKLRSPGTACGAGPDGFVAAHRYRQERDGENRMVAQVAAS